MKPSTNTNWDKLKSMSDTDIDYSDIPQSEDNFWNNADLILPHKKVELRLQVDEDIAKWVKEFGSKSNEAINNLLRSYLISTKQLTMNV